MNAVILFLANGAKLGLGFLSYVIIARELGAEGLGLFSASASTVSILCYVVDLGINGGMLIMTAKSLQRGETDTAERLAAANILFKLFIGAIFFIAAVWMGKFIGIHVYGKQGLVFPLQIIFFGLLLTLIQDVMDFTIRAYGRFGFYSLFRLLSASSIFIGIFILSAIKNISPVSAIIAYYWIAPAVTIIISFLFFMTAYNFKSHDLLLRASLSLKPLFASLSDLVSFSKWLFIGGLTEGIARNINTVILAKTAPISEVGIYDAALKLSDVMEIFSATSSALLLTSAASLLSRDEAKVFIKERIKILGIFSAGILLVIPFSGAVIKTLFGESYLPSAGIFNILIISSIAEILSQPFLYTLYSMERPERVAAMRTILSILSVILAIIFIGLYGVKGAAISLLIFRISGLIIFGRAAWKITRNT